MVKSVSEKNLLLALLGPRIKLDRLPVHQLS